MWALNFGPVSPKPGLYFPESGKSSSRYLQRWKSSTFRVGHPENIVSSYKKWPEITKSPGEPPSGFGTTIRKVKLEWAQIYSRHHLSDPKSEGSGLKIPALRAGISKPGTLLSGSERWCRLEAWASHVGFSGLLCQTPTEVRRDFFISGHFLYELTIFSGCPTRNVLLLYL